MGDNLGNCFKYLNTVKVRCSAFGIPNRTCISLQTSRLLHRRPREQRADDAEMLCGGEWDKTMSISIISMSLEKIIKEKKSCPIKLFALGKHNDKCFPWY